MTGCFNGIIIIVILQINITESKPGEMPPLQIKSQRLFPGEKINLNEINKIAF